MAKSRRPAKKPKAQPRRGLGPAYAAILLSMSLAAYGQFRAQVLLPKPKAAPSAGAGQAPTLVRGPILGAEGEILARSRSVYQIGIDYSRTVLAPGYLARAAAITGLPAGELAGYDAKPEKTRLWSVPMTRGQAEELKQVGRDWSANGVWVIPAVDRAFSSGEPLAGVLGSVVEVEGRAKGLVGLEREFGAFLEGGGSLPESLAGAAPEIRALVKEADPGLERSRSIQLTIRPRLQEAAYEAIRIAAEEAKALRAAAVVLDPRTGSLLALANWPSYDPAGRAKDGADFNAAVSGLYEPGSTLKLLTLAQALQAGTLRPGQKLQSTSRLMVDRFNSVGNSVGGFGLIDEREAIARSCNTSAAQWALALGQARLFDFYEKVGMTRPTRLGLGQEPRGLMKKDGGAPRLQAANIGFGQSINCTPLQLAAAFGMLANGGEMMEPRLVARAGGIDLGPESRGRFLRPEVCRTVLSAAEDVITQDYGTGRSLAVPGLRMAGKTGTAQKLGSGRAKDRAQYVSSFVGFAPMPKPDYVVLVMVDDPREGHYGAQVAGPAYRRIIEAMLDQGLLEREPERYNVANEPEPARNPEPVRPRAD